ncbi:MAG: nickel insertion protein, partial [Thermodesulfobacteriota bacterium]
MATSSPIAYLDCFSGISGDMLLGALLHSGVEEGVLLAGLGQIEGVDFQLSVSDDIRSGIGCKQVSVHSPSRQQLRHLSDILHLLKKSHLPSDISEKAGHIFTLLARAEAKVHNMDIE